MTLIDLTNVLDLAVIDPVTGSVDVAAVGGPDAVRRGHQPDRLGRPQEAARG